MRAFKEKKAYGEYIRRQRRKRGEIREKTVESGLQTAQKIDRADVVKDSLAVNTTGTVGTVGKAVKQSDSVESTVLDVSAALAAMEAKKMVKRLAETDIRKEERVDERMRNHGNRFGIEKYDEVTKGKHAKSRETEKEQEEVHETDDKKQRGTKVGNSHKLQQEKQEYSKKQKAKAVKGRKKEIFLKENRKIPDENPIYLISEDKTNLVKHFVRKKCFSLIMGSGVVTAVVPIFAVIIFFVIILVFFGWLTPFTYVLTGSEEVYKADTDEEIIDGYVFMVKNYMDVTQAYYYAVYGDWFGGVYQYDNADIDFGEFFAGYTEKLVEDIQESYKPLLAEASSSEQAMSIGQAMGEEISQALANAEDAALEEYEALLESFNDQLAPGEVRRQPFELPVGGGSNDIYDSADFNGYPICGTNHFGNKEIDSELSAEELLSYIALYKSLITLNPADEETEELPNITTVDIMNFLRKRNLSA